MKLVIFLMIAAILITGCFRKTQSGAEASLQKRVDTLSSEVASLKSQLDLAQFHMVMHDGNDDIAFSSIRDSIAQLRDGGPAYLSATAKGFGVARTPLGILLPISVGNVSPYLSGYKVTLAIGNTCDADLGDVELSIKYGPTPPNISSNLKPNATDKQSANPDAESQWKKSLHQYKCQIDKSLIHGIWNKLDVILSPCKPTDLDYMEISVSPARIYMDNDTRQ